MNENRVPGIWKWTVILLIACNVGLILTIWLKPQQGGRNGHHRGGGAARNYVIAQLKFTDKQVAQYDLLINAHRDSMDLFRDASAGLRKLLFENIKHAPGGINTDSIAQLIAHNQQEIETVTYRHFVQVRTEICTDVQKQQLDAIMEEVIKKLNGGGGPPHKPGQKRPPNDQEGDGDGPTDEDHAPPPPPPPGDH